MLFMQMSKTIADNALKRDGTILHSYHFIPMGSKECRGTLFGSYMIWGTKSVGPLFVSYIYGEQKPHLHDT